jgi:ribosomal protein L37E
MSELGIIPDVFELSPGDCETPEHETCSECGERIWPQDEYCMGCGANREDENG